MMRTFPSTDVRSSRRRNGQPSARPDAAHLQEGRDYARQRGIIIADTKFEFGRTAKGITLADEVLTPDSSRFWPADKYAPGRAQDSYDKQYVRDYLEANSLEQTTAGSGPSAGRRAPYQRKVSRGLLPAYGTQAGCLTAAFPRLPSELAL